MSTPDFPTDPEQDRLAAQDRAAAERYYAGDRDSYGPSVERDRRARFAEAQARAALTYVPEQRDPRGAYDARHFATGCKPPMHSAECQDYTTPPMPVVVPPPWDPRTETYSTWRAKHFPDAEPLPHGWTRDQADPLAAARPVLGDPRTVDGYPPLTPDRSMWAHPAPASLPYVAPGTPGPRVRDHMVCPPWVHGVITLLVAGLWAPIWWLDYRHGRKKLLRAVEARRG